MFLVNKEGMRNKNLPGEIIVNYPVTVCEVHVTRRITLRSVHCTWAREESWNNENSNRALTVEKRQRLTALRRLTELKSEFM